MQAIILAAGMGTRIRDHFELPKGFIQIGDEPLIAKSVKQLQYVGITEIAIITGHLAHFYNDFAQSDNSINTFFNKHYHTYGSLYSLYCAKQFCHSDCLILESDILYETHALTSLIHHPSPDAILLSGKTNSGDEVYVQTESNYLVDMSKNISILTEHHILGEFVGINKLSHTAFRKFMTLLEQNDSALKSGHYEENGLVMLGQQVPIYCHKVSDLLWAEIDDTQQLQKAKQIHRQIQQKQPKALVKEPL